ncbi:MAG: DUF4367 domain-containing protein [Oscillospiraceae bacterium]|nr:DUF4367 domain-containing protein [Oscillospiraceae bacterium]
MNDRESNDVVFEALFRQAVIDNFYEEIDSIPSNEELAKIYKFTPEFEIRMKKLINRELRKGYIIKTLKYARKVAAVFLIIITVLFGVLLINPEVRAVIVKTIVEWHDKFTSITFNTEISKVQSKKWVPEYLPDGFALNSEEIIGPITSIVYSSVNEDNIYFSFMPVSAGSNFSIDNENHNIIKSTINGNEAFFAEASSQNFDNGILWVANDYKFEIWSKLPINELVKIAQSILEK